MPTRASATGNNTKVPAGFTYLGQFVDHDITLDLTLDRREGSGPAGDREFPHARARPRLDLRARPRTAAASSMRAIPATPTAIPGSKIPDRQDDQRAGLGNVTGDHRNDLPRNPEGFALIGDHRNDENLLVAQTHLAMLKFHNKVCDHLIAARQARRHGLHRGAPDRDVALPVDGAARFRRAASPSPGSSRRSSHEGRKFYRFKKMPYMPVEFSGAAYRLGHSMVREAYSHNRIFTFGGADPPGTLESAVPVHRPFRRHRRRSCAEPAYGPTPIPVLSSNWIIDWRRYFKTRRPIRLRAA